MKKVLFLNRVRGYFAFNSKVLRVMRLTSYLVLLTIFQAVAGNSYSQNTKLSFKMNDAKVKDVLNVIEENSEFYFLFNSKLVDVERKVDINVSNQQIDKILTNLFAGFNVGYTVMDRQIIIQPNAVPAEIISEQQRSVTGVVKDETDAPVPGVTIVVKGTTHGALSDLDGKYTLALTAGDKVLVFSFVGMKSQEVTIGDQRTINVTMVSESIGIEEVVAIGYGVQKKVTASGSIVSTKGEELMKSPTSNLSNNLVGRLPGLTAVTRSGEPGNDGSTLRIRGTNTLGSGKENDPLIVVDGIANRGMERLNPSDIESITILKDASAAIYGSQAANGVVLITTKRGGIGKPKITASMNAGVTQPTKIPEMANATQYATMLNEIAYYATPLKGRNQKYSADDLQKYTDGSDPWGHPNTDWFAAVFKPWSTQNQQNVSISGGTENMKYFISLGAKYADGIYRNSATNYKQYDFRTNIDGKVNKYINIAFDVDGRQEVRDYPTRSAGSIFRMLMRGNPTLPAYWPDGTPGPDIEYGDNPAVTTTAATGYDLDKRYILESNVRAVVNIPWVSGLSITTNASVDKNFLFHKKFETPWYLYTWDGNADHKVTKGIRGLVAPQLSEDMGDEQRITVNAYAAYEKTFAEIHNVKVMAGIERRSGHRDVFNAFRKNYLSASVDQLFVGASDQYMSNSGSATQSAYASYFGRVNYDMSKKYLAEFVWRYDGSYMFPNEKRFGFFPGISAGWRISEENFWKDNLAVINDFKIRGSWGQTGNDRIQEYMYLASYGFDINRDGVIDGSDNRSYVFGSTESKLLGEIKIQNPNVTWEVATQSNIGFDALLMKSKFSVSADLFSNVRTQILINRNSSVPSSTGLTGMLPPQNIGEVKNIGFEGAIGYNDNIGDFAYSVSVNGSYSKNKIVFWDETPGLPSYQQSTGKPIGSTLYYQAIGIYKDQAQIDATPHWAGAQPGDVIFKDVGGPDVKGADGQVTNPPDGKIDGLDKVMNEKNNMPRFIGGLNINLKYKGFDLSMLVQGATGSMQYVNPESGEIGNYYKEYVVNRWTPENTVTSYPRAWNRDNEYWRSQANTFWLQNMNYVRLKNLEIGYSLPANVNKLLGIDGLRIYMNGVNLLTLSKQKLIDPEQQQGTDYPLQKVVNGGITLTF
jgi:TonB-linked SusC/RagA family outer membrane protein